MISRTDVAAHLEAGAKVGFLKSRNAYRPLRAAFAQEAPSDGAFEIYTDMGASPWPRQAGGQSGSSTDARTGAEQTSGLHEGGPIVVLGGEERGKIVYNQDWDVAIGIYHNAINDARVSGLEQWAQNAGARFEQHIDYLCFDALNSGESSTGNYGAAYDGLSFFNDAHVDAAAEYQTTQDNKLALTLSLDNFETAYVAAGSFKDSRGQPMGGLGHNLLIHSLTLQRTAAQITDNVEAYDTGNRERNPYAGQITRLTAPGGWLDTTAWYLLDVTNGKPLIVQQRQAPLLHVWDDYTQTASGIRYYSFVARYTVTYSDWRLAIQGNS